MSVLQTLLTFVVPSVGLYLLIAVLVALPRRTRRPRYRVGRPWPFEPLFWTANPRGAGLPAPDPRSATGERGGARGSW